METNATADPSGAAGAEAERCRCGAGPHPERPGRCLRGHVLRGNDLAVVSGARSVAFWREHDAALRDLQRAVVEDAGHTLADAPRALLEAATGFAQAVLVRDSAFARVAEDGGPLSSAGRGRRAFGVWVQAADRCERHLRLLGLKREPRPVLSLEDALAAVDADPEQVEAGDA